MQNVGEIIEDKVPVEIANAQTKANQQDKEVVANKTSNNQQQNETTGNGQRKKMEEPKYSDNEKHRKDNKTYNYRSTSTRERIEMKMRGKEDNINSELAQEKNTDINNRDPCPLCNRPLKTGLECGSLFLEEISACAAVHTHCVMDACNCVQSIILLPCMVGCYSCLLH